jgi:hypothetical protein
LKKTAIVDMGDKIGTGVARMFWGLNAHRMFGSNPMLYGDGTEPVTLGPGTMVFGLAEQQGDTDDFVTVGGVLVAEINRHHRRCSVHVSVDEANKSRGHARNGLVLAAEIMAHSFGIEKFITYVLKNTPGHAIAKIMGMEEEGVLKGFTLTPEGRCDTLIMGGLWPDLKEKNADAISKITWTGM